MSWKRPPIGARIRVTDVLEGVVTRHYDIGTFVVGGGQLDSGQHIAPLAGDGEGWTRTVEVLEPPRPDEPTGVNAVVLARGKAWSPGDDRELFVLVSGTSDEWWELARASASVRWVWDELKDITVLHPGGIE